MDYSLAKDDGDAICPLFKLQYGSPSIVRGPAKSRSGWLYGQQSKINFIMILNVDLCLCPFVVDIKVISFSFKILGQGPGRCAPALARK